MILSGNKREEPHTGELVDGDSYLVEKKEPVTDMSGSVSAAEYRS